MTLLRWSSRRPSGGLGPRSSALAVAAIALVSAAANTRFDAPPRFDGAGYAVLGRSLAAGLGYREGSHPDAPPHTHFPPAYPLSLALLFRASGPSSAAAHALSVAFAVAAVLATWCWLRRLYAPPVALVLAAALATNWTWGRAGGAIQSEPLFFLLSALVLLATGRSRDRDSAGRGLVAGLLLGACVLTRHVGACLAAAVVLDLVLRGKPRTAAAASAAAAACVAPWIGWLIRAGRGSQAGLFVPGGWLSLAPRQVVFYVQRLPDQIVGPFVEIATVYAGRPGLARVATGWAVAVTAVVALGWLRTLRTARRRLAGLVPAVTLALLMVWPFTEAGRFLVPLVPFLLVGAVEGLGPVLSRVVRRPRLAAACLLVALSLPYAAYSVATGRADAQRRTHRAFDAASAWIAREAKRPGPVLCQYPADLSWQTGRQALEPGKDDPGAIAGLIDRYGVAYLLVEDRPFSHAAADPLGRFVAAQPSRVRLAWGSRGAVAVYEVIPGRRP